MNLAYEFLPLASRSKSLLLTNDMQAGGLREGISRDGAQCKLLPSSNCAIFFYLPIFSTLARPL